MMLAYNALLDSNTQAVLALSTGISGIVFMAECMNDTSLASAVNYPNYTKARLFRKEPFFLLSLSLDKYPEWTWKWTERKFVRTLPNALTEDLRAKSRLAIAKLEAITRITHNINVARYKVRMGLGLQETVYLTKKIQAQRFKDSGYDEGTIMEYSYVLQYADYAGISLKEAADDILFKARLDDQFLANTELLRLRYFNKIRNAANSGQLPGVMEEFMRDCYM